MPLYKAEAINLRAINLGEADKLVTLFSRGYGKIRAVAKGARRTKSKFGGRLEIFTYNSLLLASGKNLDIVSQCETIESFYRIREGADRLKTGAYFLKLVDLTTEVGQRNDELFDLLLNSLFLLQKAEDLNQLARSFEVKLTNVEGFFPNLEKLHCSKQIKDAINQLDNGNFETRIERGILKNIENMFKLWISDHIGRDLNKLNIMESF
ncbi:DNA repair protein RecO [Candidatus Margulisiibacteriota bacterium]